jgi:hypothetical protein
MSGSPADPALAGPALAGPVLAGTVAEPQAVSPATAAESTAATAGILTNCRRACIGCLQTRGLKAASAVYDAARPVRVVRARPVACGYGPVAPGLTT